MPSDIIRHSFINGFNGLRGLAAVSVILTHLQIFKWLEDNGIIPNPLVRSLDGTVGVQAFFVLSGFLITHLMHQEAERHGHISIYNFFIRRALRILPLYFFVLLIITALKLLGTEATSWRGILFAGTYLTNFIPKDWYAPILGHTWSLAVEEHFYLIWPFVFILAGKKLPQLIISVVIFSVALQVFLQHATTTSHAFFVERWSFIAGRDIALGCLFATLLSRDSVQTSSRILARRSALGLALLLWLSEVWLPAPQTAITLVRGIGLGLIISWIFLNQHSVVTRCLEWRPLRYLGIISYGLYMYQGLFLSTGPYRAANQTWPPDPHLGLVLLIIVTPLSYHLLEKPLLRLKGRFQKSHKDTGMTTQAIPN